MKIALPYILIATFGIGAMVGSATFSTVYDPEVAAADAMNMAKQAYYYGCVQSQPKECGKTMCQNQTAVCRKKSELYYETLIGIGN